MKYSGDGAKRITVLAGLAAAEVYFVYYFLQHRNFEAFLVLTTVIVILFATFYWINWLIRHGINNFHVCMVMGVGAAALICWQKGYRILSIGVILAGIFFSMILLRRMLISMDKNQQEKNLKEYRKEVNGLMPITREALNLLFFLALGVCLWAQDGFHLVLGAWLFLIFPLWYAGKVIYRFFWTNWASDDEDASIEGDN